MIKTPLTARDILSNSSACGAIRNFLTLKREWPFRKKGHTYLGNYFFNDNLCPKPEIDYQALDQPVSRHNTLFKELVSTFDSPDSLLDAQNRLDEIFIKIKTALA